MVRTKNKTIKMKSIAICLAIIMVISIIGSVFNVVFAVEAGTIQFSGMVSVESGYATFEAMTNPGIEAGRIIGIKASETEGFTGSDGDFGAIQSDLGGNKCIYENLTSGTYTFKAIVNDEYTLNNVMVGSPENPAGSAVTITPVEGTDNEFTFEIPVTDGNTAMVNPSFAYTPQGNNQGGPGEGGYQQQSNIQIWIDGITGNGTDGAVIDETMNPQITSYEGTGFSIHTDAWHSNYELEFPEGGTSIGAIRIEGQGTLTLNPGTEELPETVVSANTINANSEGYSIISLNPTSNIGVETKQGGGNGNLKLLGGIDIRGNFCAFDKNVQIGSSSQNSSTGIKANGIIIQYAKLTMYSTGTLFSGISSENKMNIHVLDNGALVANSTYSGDTLNNVGDLVVRSAGQADISTTGTMGSVNKKVLYYDFVNFETTAQAEEMEDVVTLTDLTDGTGTAEGHNGKYEMTTTTNSIHLKSLSNPLFTLSFNMMDENGNIVEDTKVEHGTVKVITACGIGRGADGRGCNDFRIEKGTPVTIVLLPDYGYQFTSGSLNGEAITTAQEGIATYQFSMPANHLHLSAVFTKTEDEIVINNEDILGVSLDNLGGQINGNAQFKVENVEDVDEESFQEAADGATIVGFTELSLNQVVLKGSQTDAWETPVTDLSEPMSVSLQVSEEVATELEKGASVGVLRDHNGEISLLEATYNKNTNELEFATDGYSTYAIVYSATELNAKSEKTETTDNDETTTKTDENIVKTGDIVLLVTIPTIVLVVAANIILTNKKRNLKNSRKRR